MTEGGTEWELKEAENAIVAANGDPRALAMAMRRHTEAQRNMMQSVLVPSFQHAVEVLVDKSAVKVIAEVHISIEQMMTAVQQVLTAHQEDAARLKKHSDEIVALQSVAADHAARLDQIDQIEEWRTGVDRRLADVEQADRDDIRAEIKDIKTALALYEAKHQELIERLAARGDDAK